VTNEYFSSSFSNIDAASNPREFVEYMDDANAMGFFRTAKQRTYELLALRTGDHVLDVGCGAGEDVRAMAEIVGPSGRAVGVDSSQTMIDAAWERSATSPPGVEFFVGNAEHLDIPDASFDACRADRVLQHLSNPVHAVSEMARVVRAGGRVVAFEPDNGGLMIDAPDKEVTRKPPAPPTPVSLAPEKPRSGPRRSRLHDVRVARFNSCVPLHVRYQPARLCRD
jgi:ubiquinone/menaquinone biosynthesis C-methylase UbiE